MDLILQKSGRGKTGQPELRTFSASHFWSVMGPSGLFIQARAFKKTAQFRLTRFPPNFPESGLGD
jgi:hypothetical protein